MANPQFFKLQVTNILTGESKVYFEDQVRIEVECEFGMVSVITPDTGSREFLLDSEQLEAVKGEL